VFQRRGRFRAQHGISPEAFVLLFLGRIRESKGVLTLLNAFEILSKDHPEAVLALCGPDEGLGEYIRSTSASKRLSVVMPGVVAGSEKAEALVDSDVFCLASFMEAQSMALLEAASYGLPIVATTASAPPEFIEANAGFFVNTGLQDFVKALCDLAESPDLRVNLGTKARSIVESRFSLQSCIERASALYHEVIMERGV
jgi:glycosyltransferase involved in cell wall biosynthesis